MLKAFKYIVFVFYIQSSLACASGADPAVFKESFVFNGDAHDLVIAKPLQPVKINEPKPLGIATAFAETQIDGVDVWVGYYLPEKNADPISGVFYGVNKGQKKFVDGNRGFFKRFGELHFAFIVDDSDQHRSFSDVYLIGVNDEKVAWAQKIYVLTGSIEDAVVVDDTLLISGTEMGQPFAGYVDIGAHPPIVHRLQKN